MSKINSLMNSINHLSSNGYNDQPEDIVAILAIIMLIIWIVLVLFVGQILWNTCLVPAVKIVNTISITQFLGILLLTLILFDPPL